MNPAALAFSDVSKSFDAKKVLANLDFIVSKGEFTVVLGPNGAGKSTSISLANGLLRPDSGTIKIFGHLAGSMEARRSMGYVPQEPAFPAHVRGIDLLHFSAAHSVKPRDIRALSLDLEMDRFLNLPVRHLSGGQRRLVSVACAFVLDLPLVILDEPTTGLDVEMRQRVWHLLGAYRAKGGSILMTTHYLAEAEALASNIVVLAAGRVAQQGSPAEIKRRYGYKRILFTSEVVPPPTLGAVSGGEHGRWLVDSREPDAALNQLLNWGKATDIDVAPLALEDVFLRLIGRPG